MANLLNFKNRLKTITSLDSVMSAMLIVTAARLQKIKMRYANAKKYAEKAKEIVENIEKKTSIASKERLVIIITSDKGLCGNFGERVENYAESFIGNPEDCHLIIIGRSKKKRLRQMFPVIIEMENISKNLNLNMVNKIAKSVIEWQNEKKGKVYIVYNEFKSAFTQKPIAMQILPLDGNENAQGKYLLEMKPPALLAGFLGQYVASLLYRALFESAMGELNSRMMLLQGATDTSLDLITELTLLINKTRQSSITSELSEIVSSFEALNEGEE